MILIYFMNDVSTNCISSILMPHINISNCSFIFLFFSLFSVDKYQGQQNDYVLLSLVRTESVGHVRDVRRMVVALSRARLGLYVFCRKNLFSNCYELGPAFKLLLKKSSNLQLIGGESHPTQRNVLEEPSEGSVLNVEGVTAMGVLVYQMVQQSQFMAK